MGRIADWLNRLKREDTIDWSHGFLDDQDTAHVLRPNVDYLTVRVARSRVVYSRKWRHTYYGALHSWCQIPHKSGTPAKFATVTSPTNLRKVDEDSLDRVVQFDLPILGPVPYRGGDVEIEAGLFSIRASDLVGPYLEVLEDLASAGGVSVFDVAKPFIEPISKGVDLLLGTDEPKELIIGVDARFKNPTAGHYAVVAAPKNRVSLDQLSLSNGDLLLDGQPLNYGYFVLEFEYAEHRQTWFELPQVMAAHQKVLDALATNRSDIVADALRLFEIEVRSSPDLTPGDAEAIAKKEKEIYASLVETSPTSTSTPAVVPELKDLNPFS